MSSVMYRSTPVVFTLYGDYESIELFKEFKGTGFEMAIIGSTYLSNRWNPAFAQKANFVRGKIHGCFQVELLVPSGPKVAWSWVIRDAFKNIVTWDSVNRLSTFPIADHARICTYWGREGQFLDDNLCKCHFLIRYQPRLGYKLCLLGTPLALGGWNERKAVVSKQLPDGSSTVEVLLHQTYELWFRWILVDKYTNIVYESDTLRELWIGYDCYTLVHDSPKWGANYLRCKVTSDERKFPFSDCIKSTDRSIIVITKKIKSFLKKSCPDSVAVETQAVDLPTVNDDSDTNATASTTTQTSSTCTIPASNVEAQTSQEFIPIQIEANVDCSTTNVNSVNVREHCASQLHRATDSFEFISSVSHSSDSNTYYARDARHEDTIDNRRKNGGYSKSDDIKYYSEEDNTNSLDVRPRSITYYSNPEQLCFSQMFIPMDGSSVDPIPVAVDPLLSDDSFTFQLWRLLPSMWQRIRLFFQNMLFG